MTIALRAAGLTATALMALMGVGSFGSPIVPAASRAGRTALVPAPRTTCIPVRGARTVRPDCRVRCKRERNVTPAFVFASDHIKNVVDEYCENIPPNPNTAQRTFAPGGWGLAISPVPIPLPGGARELLAVGEWTGNPAAQGTISIYQVAPLGFTALVGPLSKLTLTLAGDPPLGVCFDGTGGLYATEWGSNQIDYWTDAQVVGAGGAPVVASMSTTAPASSPFNGYYLACDFDVLSIPPSPPPKENYVMVDGVDSNGNVDVASFDASVAPNTKVAWTLGPAVAHYPGGMTINRYDYLVVNDEGVRALVDLGREPWIFGINAACVYSGSTSWYLPIAFDDTQVEIWAGNTTSSGGSQFSTNAVSNLYPLAGSPCPPGESGGPTAAIATSQFLGIAVYKNTGV